MANKYNGYIYDSCSWGVTVAWNDGTHEEFYYNNYWNRQELYDILDNNMIANNYEEYRRTENATV